MFKYTLHDFIGPYTLENKQRTNRRTGCAQRSLQVTIEHIRQFTSIYKEKNGIGLHR